MRVETVESDGIVFGMLGRAPAMLEAVVSVRESAAWHVGLRSPTLPVQGFEIVIAVVLLITREIPFDKEDRQYLELRQG